MEEFLNPLKILTELKLKEDIIACDFGSGSGGWTIPLAKILENGKVYAIDILEEPISALNSRIVLEKLANIQTIRANVEDKNGSTLAESAVDLILMTNLLFQTEDKGAVFSEAKRILKRGGKVLVIDWKLNSPFGPNEGRVSAEEVKKIAKNYGLKLEKEFEAGVYHYGLIFKKL
jgi:ubiquinone/menaquinone biosynthesis C-methylase UbiE